MKKFSEQINLNTVLLGIIGFFLIRAVNQLDALATQQGMLAQRVTRVEAIIGTVLKSSGNNNNP